MDNQHAQRIPLLIAAGAGLAAALALVLAWVVISRIGGGTHRFDTSRTSVVREIRQIERLETAVFTIEKIIEAGTQGNVLQEVLYGDRILLVAHGEVVAGMDLSEVTEKDIRVSGDRLTLKLPAPEIFFARLDNARTRVYDRKLGLLSRGQKDLEAEAREVAEESIRSAACEAEILEHAKQNAIKQMTSLFAAAGFRSVRVQIPDAECR